MKKWGKILSQADTFDDSKYGKKGKKGSKVSETKEQSGSGLVVVGTLVALVLAAVASQN